MLKIAVLGIVVWGIAGGVTARAQDHSQLPEGVTVLGVGVAKGMPDLARIEVRMQGKAEITDDALVKYQAVPQAADRALEKLKLENLKVSERGPALSSGGSGNAQMMMGNMGGESTASTEISGVLRADLTNLQGTSRDDVWKTIGKVLDAIRDAGGNVGPSSADMQMAWRFGMMPEAGTSVKFVVSDLKPLREQSYESRVGRRPRHAANGWPSWEASSWDVSWPCRICRLPTNHPAHRRMPYFWFNNQGEEETPEDPDEIEVEKLAEVPLTVQLLVRFEIAAGSENPPAAQRQQAGRCESLHSIG